MKNVTIVGILAAAIFFTGCQSAISKVRNGYLGYNNTTTVGQALEHTFANGKWKSFETEKGATIVEFDGTEPFSNNFAFENAVTPACLNRPACAALAKQLENYCNSDAGKSLYSKDQSSYDARKAQIAQLKQQKSDLYAQIDKLRKTPSKIKVSSSSPIPVAEQLDQAKKESDLKDQEISELSKRADELDTQEMQLSNQLYSASDGHSSCLVGTYKQHANDPIPVAVQFSINANGTFQYYANDMSWSADMVLEAMYK